MVFALEQGSELAQQQLRPVSGDDQGNVGNLKSVVGGSGGFNIVAVNGTQRFRTVVYHSMQTIFEGIHQRARGDLINPVPGVHGAVAGEEVEDFRLLVVVGV